jgi:hypothetical protein
MFFGLILISASIFYVKPAQAKFGDSIDSFKQKMVSHFKYVSMEKKNEKIYYHFSVNTDRKIQQNSAGFAGGLTITTEKGKISGESLLVQLGNDQNIGNKLAAILCLNLAYDALGKPIPNSDQDKQTEFNAYSKATSDALSGQPGHINYPGYSSQLIFSQTHDGNLLFVINPSPVTKP